MQETRNNCFGSKIRSTTLLQAKKVSTSAEMRYCYISALVLTCFRLMKGRTTYFRPETIVASLLQLMVLIFKVFFNHLKTASL